MISAILAMKNFASRFQRRLKAKQTEKSENFLASQEVRGLQTNNEGTYKVAELIFPFLSFEYKECQHVLLNALMLLIC